MSNDEIKTESPPENNNCTLISIKNEVIDSEYDNKVIEERRDNDCNLITTIAAKRDLETSSKFEENNLKETPDTEKNNTQNDDIIEKSPSSSASSNINMFTRKRRLLQNMPTCEPINMKRKSETVNDQPINTLTKQTNQKYEIFKPTIKIQKKELCNNNVINVINDLSDSPKISQNESITVTAQESSNIKETSSQISDDFSLNEKYKNNTNQNVTIYNNDSEDFKRLDKNFEAKNGMFKKYI